MSTPESTVIIGAGINGLSTAFYLARAQQHGNNIIVVDIAPDNLSAASAKANGVLSDYNRVGPAADLAHLSWKLHQQLAVEHSGVVNWGYVKTVRHHLCNFGNKSHGLVPQYALPGWMRDRERYLQEVTGNPYNCARLDPRKFATFLLQKCEEYGVSTSFEAEIGSVQLDQQGVVAVVIEDKDGAHRVDCRNLVVAAGAWSGRVIRKLFPESRFQPRFDESHGSAGNWLIITTPRPSGSEYCHQVYVEGIAGIPVEISDYHDGRLYVGGYLAEAEPLPATPVEVEAQPVPIAEMASIASQFVDFKHGKPEILETGRCYRPILTDGRPIIAEIPTHTLTGRAYNAAHGARLRSGVFVNTGQGTSGICMGPGSGLVTSELIRGLQPSADISGLGIPK
ncbi:fad dependent oxidoreductase [Stemphylium lycopersici]|uniref:Fad dependent oxidoreductase n=1 Tax=Stemphylium lycopersici TaxID=183478 RepID=A0A364NAL1_STELY|nr:fad dependent oxidoreductase [Stemphylium lycopersici]